MFVLELAYEAPLERIDALLPQHARWLDRHYASGAFLASGRKVPREGGVILAAGGRERAEMEALVATDPFVEAGACSYRITEFVAARTAEALAEYEEYLS